MATGPHSAISEAEVVGSRYKNWCWKRLRVVSYGFLGGSSLKSLLPAGLKARTMTFVVLIEYVSYAKNCGFLEVVVTAEIVKGSLQYVSCKLVAGKV